jgi:hypothetical protein
MSETKAFYSAEIADCDPTKWQPCPPALSYRLCCDRITSDGLRMVDNDELNKASRTIDELKVDLALITLRLLVHKYAPSQQRWPLGQTDGGQWRPADGSSESSGTIQVASRIRRGLLDQCDEQMESDKDACRASQSELCWSLVLPRWNAYIRGDYVPELLHEVPE